MCTNTQICLRRRPVVVVGLAAGGLLLAGGSTDGRSGLLGDADRGLFGCCCCCCRLAGWRRRRRRLNGLWLATTGGLVCLLVVPAGQRVAYGRVGLDGSWSCGGEQSSPKWEAVVGTDVPRMPVCVGRAGASPLTMRRTWSVRDARRRRRSRSRVGRPKRRPREKDGSNGGLPGNEGRIARRTAGHHTRNSACTLPE